MNPVVWTMPVSAGIVCFWTESNHSARSIDYGNDKLAIAVIAYKRVIVAGRSLHVALCRSPGHHDGRQCRLTVVPMDGDSFAVTARIALAEWASPHIARVLRYLCEGALSADGRKGSLASVERFLNFRTAWRVETIGNAQIGQSVVTLGRLVLEENARTDAFVWDGARLNALKPRVVACGDLSIFVWAKGGGGIAYFSHRKRLLEIETEPARPGARERIVATLGSLAAPMFDQIVQKLATVVPEQDSGPLGAFLRDIVIAPKPTRGAPAPLSRPPGIYRVGAHLFVMIRQTQTEIGSLEPVTLTWLGEPSGHRPAMVLSGVCLDTGDTVHLHQLSASAMPEDQSICAARRSASEAAVWVPIRDLSEPGTVAELRASIDFEKAGDDLLADLYAPMQHALAQTQLGTKLGRRRCAGSERDAPGESNAPLVTVLSDGDPHATELTLVSLISTIGAARYDLRLVLRAQDDAEQAAEELERYARQSNCRAELILNAVHRPLSTTLKLLLADDGSRDGVVLPAGTVLADRDWMARLAEEFARHPETLFVGEPADARPTEVAGSIEQPFDPWRRARADRTAALAWRGDPELANRLHGGLDTMQGVVAGLVRTAAGRMNVRASPALRSIDRRKVDSSKANGRIRLDQAVLRTLEPTIAPG